MNNKCNNCAKFLTCNRKECKKITFVEAEILERPKTIVKKDWEQQISELNTEAEKSFRAIANGMKKAGTSLEECLKRLNRNNQGIEDRLIIGYDQAKGKDHTCLLVSRKHREELTVINEFFNEEAEEIYNKLIKCQDIEKG